PATSVSTAPPTPAVVTAISSTNSGRVPLGAARPARAKNRKPVSPRERPAPRAAHRNGSG
ncbi:hypothetical protein GA0115251_124212, partial [Streptomyces sp. TverLS-915]|uniref:hypothetical protein n=1 Tax=Streptomyces sp. TverLS-915 TaxID=1839763 RepID=UPI00081DD27F